MDLKKIDEIIETHKAEKGALVSILHAIQAEEGYLPDEALSYLSDTLHIPLGEISRVVSYFDKAFSLTPKVTHTIKVCQGTSCYLKHSDQTLTEINEELEKEGDGKNFQVTTPRCMGCCTIAPVVEIDGKLYDKDSAKSTIIKLKGEK